MAGSDVELLDIERGLVVAPAGCGKTQLIADALKRHIGHKPILVLTHTNAGVAALRSRLDRAGVKPDKYRLATIDGWAIRLISTFPGQSGHDPNIISGQRPNYTKIREAAFKLLKAKHISDVIAANYARLFVDEYQDCSIRQHAIIYYTSAILPTCVVGDPLQAIFGFGDDSLADWEKHVCGRFPIVGELNKPWRWINANSEPLGQWILETRCNLIAAKGIDLTSAPDNVSWVQLGTPNDHQKLLEAGRVAPPDNNGSVLIIGESTSPDSQRRFASQTPGAVTVEAVDLRDLVSFARNFDISASDALQQIAEFAQSVMTNVGAADLVSRVNILTRGTARKAATATEQAALNFESNRSPQCIASLLVEINKEAGVRSHRPDILRACLRALHTWSADGVTFHEAAIHIREQNRPLGRSLPRRAVGSTLLLKGLEAEVVVILNADVLDARNLYVAMTRGSKKVIICSRSSILNPIH